jgi:hypothetical protein
MARWVIPLIACLVGAAGGILYGRVIDPVKYVDTTPASLRVDYRTDYVLMVAEAYHANPDEALASQRLAILGTESPATIAQAALEEGQRVGYAAADVALLQELTRVLQASAPITPAAGGTP